MDENEMIETVAMPPNGRVIEVCDKCLRACCWYGEFMCDEARTAGLTYKTVEELKALKREHWNYWSDEYLKRVFGTIPNHQDKVASGGPL